MEIEHRPNTDIDRKQWDALVKTSPQGSIYALSEFMDLVFPDWEALMALENKAPIAVLPFFPKRKWGIRYAFQPHFGQHQGILFGDLSKSSRAGIYKKKRKIVKKLVEALDKQHRVFSQNFSPGFDYGLPFHWKGYALNTRYTYQLGLPGSDESLFANFTNGHQRHINKALKRDIQPIEAPSASTCAQIINNVMAEKNIGSNTNAAIRSKIIDWAIQSGNGFPMVLEKDGQPACAGLFLQFQDTTYFFFGASYHEAKQSGAMYLLLWEAMKKVNQKGHVFDFEGSMIEPIEIFFQGFGAAPVPYLHIYKNQLPLRILWKILGY